MEQRVRVQKCNSDGTAQVLHLRESACSGDCHKCSGCGAVQQSMVLTAKNPIGARPGDLVVIQSATGPVLAAAAVLYMVPLILFFLGYLLGAVAWQKGGLVGCIAFCLGLAAAAVYDRKVVQKQKTEYTITGYWKGPASWENEG